MRSVTITVALLASTASAAPVRELGAVVAAHARDAGDVIVTESQVRRSDGTLVRVVQLGGVVDGIAEVYSHQPAPLVRGDVVDLATLQVVSTAVTPGTAQYGIVHTASSKLPVWRASACNQVHFGASITDAQAQVIEAAFDAWSAAAAGCGPLVLARGPERLRAVADGLDSIHVLTDRWCRPATETEPELCYSPDATGITRLRFVDDPFAADDGRIIEADVLLNAVNYRLDVVDPARATTAIDLPSVVTHELGHLLGISHSCGTGGEAWPLDHAGNAVPDCEGLAPTSPAALSTMFYKLGAGEIAQRSLEPVDRVAACSLARGTECTIDVTGGTGCSSSRPSSLGIALVLLAIGSQVSPSRRRRRSLP